MSGSRLLMNHHHLLQGIGVIWLLSISQTVLAAVGQVIAVRIWPSFIYTRVIIESNSTLKYKQFFLKNPKRVVIDFKYMNLNSMLKGMEAQISSDDPYIKSARVGQFNSQIVRVVFELKQNVKTQLFLLGLNTKFKESLVIYFYPVNTVSFQDPLMVLLENYSENGLMKIPLIKNGLDLSKVKFNRPIMIMLDPGHGGEDSGALGKYNTREKDVVLKIALRLKTLINRESNMCAYMTRDRDIFMPLKARIIKAQKYNADLFISIHADAFTSCKPNGSSVFALSTKSATSTAARYLANIQNASGLIKGVNKSGDHYVDHTIFDMVQSLTITDSLKFGEAVLGKLARVNKLHKNIVEQAGFEVLKAPDIPSILVETAFISNAEEELKLNTAKFQQEVAESMLAGIKSYLSDSSTLARLNRNHFLSESGNLEGRS